MIRRGGGVKPALQLIFCTGLVLPMASQALADTLFRCEFTQECPTGQPCNDTQPQVMQLAHDARDPGLWSLTTGDGQDIQFTSLALETQDLRAFVSVAIDPDASAVSLLTVFGDGQAIMAIHGVFYSPGSVTHLGTCVPKDG